MKLNGERTKINEIEIKSELFEVIVQDYPMTNYPKNYDKALLPEARVTGLILNRDVEHFHSLRLTGRQGARCARIAL
jgi:hypothetical protein